jgi:hypothetical protein
LVPNKLFGTLIFAGWSEATMNQKIQVTNISPPWRHFHRKKRGEKAKSIRAILDSIFCFLQVPQSTVVLERNVFSHILNPR